jgi:cyclophilin family peptidyl-prolyl cis-trans isomerase
MRRIRQKSASISVSERLGLILIFVMFVLVVGMTILVIDDERQLQSHNHGVVQRPGGLRLQSKIEKERPHSAFVSADSLSSSSSRTIDPIVNGNEKRKEKQGVTKASNNDEKRMKLPLLDPNCRQNVPLDHRQHIVTPPSGPVSLVCCKGTTGIFNIAVHHAWAPIGAQRFMNMTREGFFTHPGVPLFRALKNFLVQFGLHADTKVQTTWHRKGNIKDDKSWLPLGPDWREKNGIKRFLKGYLAYAGAGKNSRGTQLIMALNDNGPLGGGSPWEVPWGQLIGEESFAALDKVFI